MITIIFSLRYESFQFRSLVSRCKPYRRVAERFKWQTITLIKIIRAVLWRFCFSFPSPCRKQASTAAYQNKHYLFLNLRDRSKHTYQLRCKFCNNNNILRLRFNNRCKSAAATKVFAIEIPRALI